jgi:hypothetical protein
MNGVYADGMLVSLSIGGPCAMAATPPRSAVFGCLIEAFWFWFSKYIYTYDDF